MKLPIPNRAVHDIYELTPDFLRSRNITLLLMDLDNTLAPYSTDEATPALKAWIASMKAAGIEPFLFSNNKGDRPSIFARQLNVDYVKLAHKPKQAALRQVLTQKSTPIERVCIIGDQIYTDVLCGSIAGAYTVVVRPISLKNPLHALRYAAETPFRLLYKVKQT
ncbi:MAG: YqeG family HAD IIIA-type phosphatase [Oscillospiraceae bacterium]|jgi:HAD superfamily phosphatase (TIGR01668 family)|nr:YqeG family HAD IIIA-type phosphatase [Oscillospiraceae bacterium]